MKIIVRPQGSLKVLGEHPALDLANSIDTERGRAIDFLTDADSIVAWAEPAGLIGRDEANIVLAAAATDEAGFVARVCALRDILYRLLDRGVVSADDAAALNRAMAGARVVASNGALDWDRSANDSRLLTARLAFQIVALAMSPGFATVRRCEAEDCDWVFFNASGRRQWCLMSGCGNVAKARRHRARQQPAP